MQSKLDQQAGSCVSPLDVSAVPLIILVLIFVVSLLVAREVDDVLLERGLGPKPRVVLHNQVPGFLPTLVHAN